MRQAADLTDEATLKAHLVSRADDVQHIGGWWANPARSEQGEPTLMMLMDDPWKRDCFARGIRDPTR
ncbi:hypothetical protein [Streptomyces sp. NPDC057682]|uniref:hypothetical protein n=1 Tax=Streptomyces sp. NPDC057682 TaxID=3346210 RepID=UPI00367A9B1C